MDRKNRDSPSIEESSEKNNIFTKPHEDDLHPPFTDKLDLKYAHNIDLGSLFRSLRYLPIHGDKVVNLR